jgi:hypothetical protein
MEDRFSADFSGVRIHADPRADRSARALNATAYTVGRNIVFGRGQYAPATDDGRKLIAHELTHVIQQGNRDSHSATGPLPIDASGEPAAERAAHRISTGQTAGPVGSGHGPSIQRQFPWMLGEMPPVEPYLEPRIIPPEPPTIPGEGIPTPGEGIPTPGNGGGTPFPQGEQIFPRPGPTAQPRPGPWFGSQPDVFPPVSTSPSEDTEPEDDKKKKDCCSKVPGSHVTFPRQGSRGQGLEAKASPLTCCPGNTVGSEPDEAIYKEQFDCIKAAAKLNPTLYDEKDWVRGHILHGKTNKSDKNLHGPGTTPKNLIIIDQSLNQKMRSWVEGPVLRLIYGPYSHVLWYHVWVDSYYPGLEFFADSVSAEYGLYDRRTGMEGPPLVPSQQFTLKRTPPPCTATGFAGGVPPVFAPSGFSTGYQSFEACGEKQSLPDFTVPNGGVSVTIDTRWVRKDSEGRVVSSTTIAGDCPKTYNLSLHRERTILWNVAISDHDLAVGSHFVLPWSHLIDGDYYLTVKINQPSSPGAGQGAGAEPVETPACCLEGDVTIVPFYAPRHPTQPELA